MSSFRRSNNDDTQARVYSAIYGYMQVLVDELERRRDIPQDVAEDILYFHDPANLRSADEREVDRRISAFMRFVDDAIARVGDDLLAGTAHERDVQDAVAGYIERLGRNAVSDRNSYRDRDGGWRRGESFSRRANTRGRGLVQAERSDRSWRSPISTPGGSNRDGGNPLARMRDREEEERNYRDRDSRPEREEPRREPQPARPARPSPIAEVVDAPPAAQEQLSFEDFDTSMLPASLSKESMDHNGLQLERVLGAPDSYGVVFALRGSVKTVVGSEESVLRSLEPITGSLGRYFANFQYQIARALHIPFDSIAPLRDAVSGKDPRETTGMYWREIDDVLAEHLRTKEKQQVESIIIDDFNKRMVTFLRKEADLTFTITLPNIRAIGDLIKLDAVPAHLREQGRFTQWVNTTLQAVLLELFSSRLVSGQNADDKNALILADGSFYLDGRTMIQAAVHTDPTVWTNWFAKYRTQRCVIIQQRSLIVSNLGVSANWEREVFDVKGATQSNCDFWSAYTEKEIVDAPLSHQIRVGQSHVYLDQQIGDQRKYRRFDTVWFLWDESASVKLVRHGYRRAAEVVQSTGTLSIS